MKAYRREGGAPIAEGDEIPDFKGITAFFVKVARLPEGNSTGRIATIRPSGDWDPADEVTFEALLEDYRTNSWTERRSNYSEYFPSVYGLVIR